MTQKRMSRNQNQLLEADMVYIKDFDLFHLLTDEKLKHLAIIAHVCYGSTDLSLHCMMLLGNRGVLKKDDIVFTVILRFVR